MHDNKLKTVEKGSDVLNGKPRAAVRERGLNIVQRHYAQLNPGPNIVLIGRQILIGRFFFKFVNGTNGFFKINIYI